jgi:hypothetical protein
MRNHLFMSTPFDVSANAAALHYRGSGRLAAIGGGSESTAKSIFTFVPPIAAHANKHLQEKMPIKMGFYQRQMVLIRYA